MLHNAFINALLAVEYNAVLVRAVLFYGRNKTDMLFSAGCTSKGHGVAAWGMNTMRIWDMFYCIAIVWAGSGSGCAMAPTAFLGMSIIV